MPHSRPRGKRAWLWLLHLVWIIGVLAAADAALWSSIPGIWRWVVLGFFAYSAIVMPLTMAQMLRTYWNAPEAADKNRQLAALQRGERLAADS
jgi:protein-S-isoprenylcysteine O-methyltransferase Ste14